MKPVLLWEVEFDHQLQGTNVWRVEALTAGEAIDRALEIISLFNAAACVAVRKIGLCYIEDAEKSDINRRRDG